MTVRNIVLSLLPIFVQEFTKRVQGSPVGYRLAKGAFWSFLGAIISRGMVLLSSIIVARLLGTTGFGAFGIIQSTVGMLGVFAGFGIGLTATKHIAEFRIINPIRAGSIIALSYNIATISGGVVAVILFIAAPWVASNMLAASHLSQLLRVSTLLIFFGTLVGTQNGILAGFEAFKKIAQLNLLSGLLSFPIMLIGVYLGGLKGVIWALAVSMIINWFLNYVTIKSEVRKAGIQCSYKDSFKEINILWRFSIPALLSGVVVEPVNWICMALLVNQPTGYSDLGIYSAIMRVKIIPEMILGILMAPLLPILSEQYGRKQRTDSFNRTIGYAFIISWLIVIPVSLIQMAAPAITLFPFGRDFVGGHSIVRWLMLQAIINGMIAPITQLLASMGRMWFSFVSRIFWGLSYMLSAYLLVPKYGGEGLAAAFTITHLVVLLPYIMYLYHYEKNIMTSLKLNKFFLISILSSLICFIASSFMSSTVVFLITAITTLSFILNISRYFKKFLIIHE